jgi:hypothetical protein
MLSIVATNFRQKDEFRNRFESYTPDAVARHAAPKAPKLDWPASGLLLEYCARSVAHDLQMRKRAAKLARLDSNPLQ